MFGIKLNKLSHIELVIVVLAAIGFFFTGRWLYSKFFPPDPYTIEVDV